MHLSASEWKQKLAVRLLCVVFGMTTTHWVLHHLHPLSSEVLDDPRNIHHLFLCDLIQDSVYGDECPRPTHSSTTHTHTHNSFNILLDSITAKCRTLCTCSGLRVGL